MSKNQVTVFTLGGPDTPSVRIDNPDPSMNVYSSYSGKQLDGIPTYGTRTDDPTGRNLFYHGGN